MPEYRRRFQPGGTFFFTVVTNDRRPLFEVERARQCLREAILAVQEARAFEVLAIVLLPQHLHCLWRLPDDDLDFSSRWGRIKSGFTKLWLSGGAVGEAICASRERRHERSVWQRRFWEHRIRDEVDMYRHVNYIHYNPVKHGLVRCPHGWPYSSFLRWVEEGYYRRDWLCDCGEPTGTAPDWIRNGDLFGE
jgi:putative transposase